MKKSQIVMFLMLLVVIPATLLLGMRLQGRSYYLLSALVALEIMVPFFMAFEGRRPQPRELVTVAVMSALVTIARVAVPLPSFKPTFAVIMLAGVAFGPETGFIVGALGALGSDFFYGQGPFTPWQMMAYGMAGLLSGFVYQHNWLPRKNWVMGLFCFVCTVTLIGPLLDTSTVTIIATKFTWENMLPIYISGFPVNVSQGTCSFLTVLLFGDAILEKLDRVKTQYGMMETDSDGV